MDLERAKIEPAGHRVLLRVVKPKSETKSGIVIAKTIQEREELSSEIGEVMAIGRTAFDAFGDWGIKEGDTVLFVRQGGKIVPNFSLTESRDEIFRIVNDEDIVGILREASNG